MRAPAADFVWTSFFPPPGCVRLLPSLLFVGLTTDSPALTGEHLKSKAGADSNARLRTCRKAVPMAKQQTKNETFQIIEPNAETVLLVGDFTEWVANPI